MLIKYNNNLICKKIYCNCAGEYDFYIANNTTLYYCPQQGTEIYFYLYKIKMVLYCNKLNKIFIQEEQDSLKPLFEFSKIKYPNLFDFLKKTQCF